jgi:hypothetical protein
MLQRKESPWHGMDRETAPDDAADAALFNAYLDDLSACPRLSAAEERALGMTAAAGRRAQARLHAAVRIPRARRATAARRPRRQRLRRRRRPQRLRRPQRRRRRPQRLRRPQRRRPMRSTSPCAPSSTTCITPAAPCAAAPTRPLRWRWSTA